MKSPGCRNSHAARYSSSRTGRRPRRYSRFVDLGVGRYTQYRDASDAFVGPRTHGGSLSPGCHSTRLSPAGEGRSTTNSVRCAGNTCSLNSTGRRRRRGSPARTASTGDPTGTSSSLASAPSASRRADRLRRAAERHRRAARRTDAARRRHGDKLAPSSAGTPHRDTANGSPSARFSRRTRSTCSTPSRHARARWRSTKPNSRIWRSATTPRSASSRSMVAELREVLTHAVAGDEPAEALPGVDQALVAEQLERAADRDPRRLVRLREVGLARQDAASSELARLDPTLEVCGDLSVADLAHLYYTCLHKVTGQPSRSTTGDQTWL